MADARIRQTPLNAQFSDELRHNAAEMFADVEQGISGISGGGLR